ncbi:hypothetical protein G6F62_015955 [Rhizopus arrhizus]|nr:hypothetical protein G6F62_015955 [Rhizopus arrhizus]
MPPARAAPSGALPMRWTPGNSTLRRSPPRTAMNCHALICGASGASCRAMAASRSSTGPGMAACWSNASRS